MILNSVFTDLEESETKSFKNVDKQSVLGVIYKFLNAVCYKKTSWPIVAWSVTEALVVVSSNCLDSLESSAERGGLVFSTEKDT